MKKLLIVFLMIFGAQENFAQTSYFTFDYNTSGHRVKRELTVVTPSSEQSEEYSAMRKSTKTEEELVSESNEQTTEENETSIVEDKSLDQICNVYPNPTFGILNINLKETGSFSYQIYSFQGQLIDSGKLQEGLQTVDLSNQSAGQFVLRIQKGSSSYANWTIIKNN